MAWKKARGIPLAFFHELLFPPSLREGGRTPMGAGGGWVENQSYKERVHHLSR